MSTTAALDATASASATATATLLLVDDEPSVLSALRRLFRPTRYQILQATSGAEALPLLRAHAVDLVISDMRMPEMNGARFLEAVRQHDPTVMRVLLTGFSDISSTIDAINRGEVHRYITKPWDDQALLLVVRDVLEQRHLMQENVRLQSLALKQNLELRRLNQHLEDRVAARTAELEQINDMLNKSFEEAHQNFELAAVVFSSLIEMRQGGIAGHSRRVALLSRNVAEAMRLDDLAVREVYLAALLHDIGKIGFPDRMLGQAVTVYGPDTLSRYRQHPHDGEAALLPLPQMRGVARIVGQHHERWDGRGFPAGLSGAEIELGARIIGAASDYDDLLQGGLSETRHTPTSARQALRGSMGTHYDPDVILALLRVLDEMAAAAAADVPVAARDLQPGMVLSQDLATPRGLVLLPTGQTLSESTIRQVMNFAQREQRPLMLSIRRDSMPRATPPPATRSLP